MVGQRTKFNYSSEKAALRAAPFPAPQIPWFNAPSNLINGSALKFMNKCFFMYIVRTIHCDGTYVYIILRCDKIKLLQCKRRGEGGGGGPRLGLGVGVGVCIVNAVSAQFHCEAGESTELLLFLFCRKSL